MFEFLKEAFHVYFKASGKDVRKFTNDKQSRKDNKLHLILLSVFGAVMFVLIVIVPCICLKKLPCMNRRSKARIVYTHQPKTIDYEQDGSGRLSPSQLGTFQKTRGLSWKRSAKSTLSSTLTESYFQLDLPYDPEWEVKFDSLEFQSLLGEGAFGRVMKGISNGLPGNPDATVVAIKMLKGEKMKKILEEKNKNTFNSKPKHSVMSLSYFMYHEQIVFQ